MRCAAVSRAAGFWFNWWVWPGAASFAIWCGRTLSVSSLVMALTAWGLFKGMYDANIFASALDVIRPEAREPRWG